MKRLNSSIPLALAFLVLISAMPSCKFSETEKRMNLFNHYYTIEPSSLLDTLKTGKTNVFSPIAEEPAHIPPDQQIPVTWTQDDYLRIADSLFEFIWNDNLDGWKLNSMHFALGCANYSVGFQNGNFRFFKNIEKNGRESRIVRIINIDPRSKFVFVTENEYYPKLVSWSSIDIGRTQLSARDILKIAENAGGHEKRLSVENACDISMLLSPDYASYNGWEVDYSRNDAGTSLYHIQIDPHTGEIRSP